MSLPRLARPLLLLLVAGCFEDEAGECDLSQPPAPWQDGDSDGYVGEDDCDDASFATNPSAEETCDGQDNDCDGATDGPESADAATWYLDADGDGYGDDAEAQTSCAALVGYVAQAGDCDDADGAFFPGAPEDDCTDPNDYNCDGSAGGEDADGDGSFACEDCDDGDPDSYPGALDPWYDGLDQDCGGEDDYDQDGDGYVPDGYAGLTTGGVAGSGTLPDGDCDDEDASVNPAGEDAPEDGVDQNCDGADATLCDADEDGFDDAASCGGLDCDDDDAAVYPGAAETCDGVDDDCDGLTDDEDDSLSGAAVWYADTDADGYGDPAVSEAACAAPAGHVSDATDCDDGDPAVNPAEDERCDPADADEDCDGLADDADASTADRSTWFADADADGYGDAASSRDACDAPAGYTADDTDCDDTDPTTNPTAPDATGDGVDSDCDGAELCYADADADGYADDAGTTASSADADCTDPGEAGDADPRTDCDDADASVNPGASEVCDDGIDNDCDGSAGSCGLSGDADTCDQDQLYGAAADDLTGFALAALGDSDGDGLSELLVGAPYADALGAEAGVAYVAEGPFSASVDLAADAIAVLQGSSAGDTFGYAVASLGDHDGDGYDDALVGALFGECCGQTNKGAAALFLGPLSGEIASEDADALLTGVWESEYVGEAVAGAADIDGDGLDDLVVGAGSYFSPASNPYEGGAAWVLLDRVGASDEIRALGAPLYGTADQEGAGKTVALEDMNADGLADVLVSAPLETTVSGGSGAVYIVHGSVSAATSLADADAVLYGAAAGDYAGQSLDAADLDEDGLPDLLVGAPFNDDAASNAGAAYLVMGSLSGALSVSAADATWRGVADDDAAGMAVAFSGDMDGDGAQEISVGAADVYGARWWSGGPYGVDGGDLALGATYLIREPAAGTASLSDADARVLGCVRYEGAGAALLGGQDLDDDGLDDLLIGATRANDPSSVASGAAWLVLGSGL